MINPDLERLIYLNDGDNGEKYDSYCDNERDSLKSKIEGELLLSEKRRTDGIEMLLEIKQLKEDLQKYSDWFEVTPKSILTVKTIFDMNQQYSNHIMDLIKDNQNLKQILEKIEESIKQVCDDPKGHPVNAWFIYRLKEILKENKK